MIILTEDMNRLDVHNAVRSLGIIENYLDYIRERVNHYGAITGNGVIIDRAFRRSGGTPRAELLNVQEYIRYLTEHLRRTFKLLHEDMNPVDAMPLSVGIFTVELYLRYIKERLNLAAFVKIAEKKIRNIITALSDSEISTLVEALIGAGRNGDTLSDVLSNAAATIAGSVYTVGESHSDILSNVAALLNINGNVYTEAETNSLADALIYAGHGAFVEGIVKSKANAVLTGGGSNAVDANIISAVVAAMQLSLEGASNANILSKAEASIKSGTHAHSSTHILSFVSANMQLSLEGGIASQVQTNAAATIIDNRRANADTNVLSNAAATISTVQKRAITETQLLSKAEAYITL